MVGLQPLMLSKLIECYRKNGKAVFWKKKEIVPFPGIYTKEMLPLAEQALAGGNRCLHDFIAAALKQNQAELTALPPELDTFENVNTPEQLKNMENLTFDGAVRRSPLQ